MSTPVCDRFKLSICITTRNRAALLSATLENILRLATPECEVVVVDGASTDDTEQVMSAFVDRNANVRYFKQHENGGVDRDFDRAVELACGEYCWLLPDDDLLKPDAIRAVLQALEHDYFLVLVNREHVEATRLTVITPTMLTIAEDRVFLPHEADALFKECWALLTYIGSFILQRKIWLERNRVRYYGSDFIHVGIIFQEPMPRDVLVIATPLISVRIGNQHWSTRSFEIWTVSWPSLVWTLALPDSAKLFATKSSREQSFYRLLWYRALSSYSLESYRRHVRPRTDRRLKRILPIMAAVTPEMLANTCCIMFALLRNKKERAQQLPWLRRSPNCFKWWRVA